MESQAIPATTLVERNGRAARQFEQESCQRAYCGQNSQQSCQCLEITQRSDRLHGCTVRKQLRFRKESQPECPTPICYDFFCAATEASLHVDFWSHMRIPSPEILLKV